MQLSEGAGMLLSASEVMALAIRGEGGFSIVSQGAWKDSRGNPVSAEEAAILDSRSPFADLLSKIPLTNEEK